jgi:exodeoxyribonuclease V beta subunit
VAADAGAWLGDARSLTDLSSENFVRDLDWGWRRTSYSNITAGAYEARVTSEPEEDVVDDEPSEPTPVAAGHDSPSLRDVPSLLSAMPVGVQVGTLVHRVFEAVDFAATDLDAELGEQVVVQQARGDVDLGDRGAVVAGLRAAVETPLGPLVDGLRLCDLTRSDRLDELTFEFPLVGGDSPTGTLTIDAVASALRSYLPSYADRLADPALRRSVSGYLTGSIDLVARVSGADGVPRFAIIDYKTNWLGGPADDLTAWHHRPAALALEMERDHYVLQALLYTVALHRYLRWRVPDYDVSRNLAGVLYLFLRGMTGADTPVVDGQPCGVFAWQPPAELVVALSDLMDVGVAA